MGRRGGRERRPSMRVAGTALPGLVHKVEHVVNLETGVGVGVIVQDVAAGDTTTLVTAAEQVDAVRPAGAGIAEVVGEKEYHSNETLLHSPGSMWTERREPGHHGARLHSVRPQARASTSGAGRRRVAIRRSDLACERGDRARPMGARAQRRRLSRGDGQHERERRAHRIDGERDRGAGYALRTRADRCGFRGDAPHARQRRGPPKRGWRARAELEPRLGQELAARVRATGKPVEILGLQESGSALAITMAGRTGVTGGKAG